MESEKDFQDFIHSEVEKIKIDKWIEGEKRHEDPGSEYEVHWVDTNAKNYRDAWCNSKCRTCSHRRECGYKTLSACEEYDDIV